MYTFPDQTNRQFVQILMDSKLLSQTASCTGHRWRKTKDFFVFCSRKICLEFFHGFSSFVLCHLCPVHKINAQTPTTAILSTHLLHGFIVNVKCRMDDFIYRKTNICLSFNFLKQYSANGTCWTSVNMQEYATSLWLLWKSQIFPDLYWNSLTCSIVPYGEKN